MEDNQPVNQPPQISLLERREIEAAIVGPIIRAFAKKFGKEQTLSIVAEVIRDLSRQRGAEIASCHQDPTLSAFATTLQEWTKGGALELEILEQDQTSLSFNVTRCKYAEMYARLGMSDLGPTLSCLRDFELTTGFNPEISLSRTQTIMEGENCCNFRFRHVNSSGNNE